MQIGDILVSGNKKRFDIVAMSIRVFAPQDKLFRWKHIKNIFNTNYPTHVAQVTYYRGRLCLANTEGVGLVPRPLSHLNDELIGVYRLPFYSIPAVADAFVDSTRAALDKPWIERRYPFLDLVADYIPYVNVRNHPEYKYCSERVRDEIALARIRAGVPSDAFNIPHPPATPDDLYRFLEEEAQCLNI